MTLQSGVLGPDQLTAGNVVSGLPQPPTTAELIPQVSALRYRSEHTHERVVNLDRAVLALSLDERQATRLALSAGRLLEDLARAGMSWSSIARIVGVTIPAVRKWRQGEAASPANRATLAKAIAFLELLEDQFMIEDPVGWLEVPLPDSALTMLDLAADGRMDLVLEFAGRRIATAAELLDRYDPEWHQTPQPDYETFVASDGQLAMRRRGSR